MAFKDISKVLYEGRWKLDYKDGNHAYYARPRINWDLPEEDPKAWGKALRPKSATTLLSNVLEKNGLLKWPMGLALRELFGFYNFTGDDGTKRVGFSKDIGTLWNVDKNMIPMSQEEALPYILSASKASDRTKKKGADIGSVVHDAIEHYVLEKPFDIGEQYMWNIKEAEYESEAEREMALKEFPEDVLKATTAFLEFEKWWLTVQPVLHGAEDILFSEKEMMCGTYDGDLGIPIEHHPHPEKFSGKTHVRCTTDWKTSKASKSAEAAMPQGVNYQYFIQDAIYEVMRREMGMEPADDFLVVSARKDGGFDTVYASELDLTVDECIEAALNVRSLFNFIDKTKAALWTNQKEEENE